MPSPESPVPGPPVIRLYVRDGCHLCDQALAVVEAARGELPDFVLELVDIEADPALHSIYLERIPVAEIDGKEVFELVADPEALAGALSPTGTL